MAAGNPRPSAASWYKDLEQETLFTVLEVGEDAIKIQYTNGEVETLSFGSWDEMALDFADPPEAWPSDFNVTELGYWDESSHPEGAPRPWDDVEGDEPGLGPQKSP